VKSTTLTAKKLSFLKCHFYLGVSWQQSCCVVAMKMKKIFWVWLIATHSVAISAKNIGHLARKEPLKTMF
jgi:hypothetical protein